MLRSIITAILAFASTNVDDIFLLMLFFGLKKYKPSTIILGQYLGIAALVVISLALAFVGSFISPRYVGFLGLFPIYLAIKQVIDFIRDKSGPGAEGVQISGARFGAIAVAGVTIANGGDNIGIYIPLFTTMEVLEKAILCIVFTIMVYFWCIIARYLAAHRLLANSLSKYAHVIMPIVLFGLGIFILYESKSLTLIF